MALQKMNDFRSRLQRYKQKLEVPNLYIVFCFLSIFAIIKANERRFVFVANNILKTLSSSKFICPLRNFSI